MTAPTNHQSQKTKPPSIFRRIAGKDKTAVQDCIDAYGNFIWTLARRFTRSTAEAETATLKIFTDIWRYAENGGEIETEEILLITQIARRRLLENSGADKTESMQSIDATNEQGADTEFSSG